MICKNKPVASLIIRGDLNPPDFGAYKVSKGNQDSQKLNSDSNLQNIKKLKELKEMIINGSGISEDNQISL